MRNEDTSWNWGLSLLQGTIFAVVTYVVIDRDWVQHWLIGVLVGLVVAHLLTTSMHETLIWLRTPEKPYFPGKVVGTTVLTQRLRHLNHISRLDRKWGLILLSAAIFLGAMAGFVHLGWMSYWYLSVYLALLIATLIPWLILGLPDLLDWWEKNKLAPIDHIEFSTHAESVPGFKFCSLVYHAEVHRWQTVRGSINVLYGDGQTPSFYVQVNARELKHAQLRFFGDADTSRFLQLPSAAHENARILVLTDTDQVPFWLDKLNDIHKGFATTITDGELEDTLLLRHFGPQDEAVFTDFHRQRIAASTTADCQTKGQGLAILQTEYGIRTDFVRLQRGDHRFEFRAIIREPKTPVYCLGGTIHLIFHRKLIVSLAIDVRLEIPADGATKPIKLSSIKLHLNQADMSAFKLDEWDGGRALILQNPQRIPAWIDRMSRIADGFKLTVRDYEGFEATVPFRAFTAKERQAFTEFLQIERDLAIKTLENMNEAPKRRRSAPIARRQKKSTRRSARTAPS